MSNQPEVAGLILAGGRGERLGGAIKSELVVGGERLLNRVAGGLQGCAPLLVAHGHLPPELLRLPRGMVPVADIGTDYGGPLAGVSAAIALLALLPEAPDLLVCAAVDTPFLPNDFVPRMLAGLGTHDCALASYAGQPYPTNAIWRVGRFAGLPVEVAAGTAPRSLKALAARCDSTIVVWPDTAAGDPFANINTPGDLAAARRRAAGPDEASD